MELEKAIASARSAERELRYRFETEKEAEWQRVSLEARLAVENAVMVARNSGVPVSKIAQAYGTKRRATIYDIINRREKTTELLTDTTNTSNRITVEPDEELRAAGYPDPWRVSVNGWPFESGRETGWVTFTKQGDKVTIRGYSELGSALHRAVIDWSDEDVLVKHIRKVIAEKE